MSTLSQNEIRGILKFMKKIQAQPSSAYPDIQQRKIKSLRTSVRKSSEAIALIFLIRLWRESGLLREWEDDYVYRTLGFLAYRNKYLGEWATVQDLLEQEDQTCQAMLLYYKETKSTQALFGLLNTYIMLKPGRRKVRLFYSLQVRDPYKEETRRVNHPQRKRGYTDKGSCRSPHERHGIPPYSEEREDRRKFINHPLLKEFLSY